MASWVNCNNCFTRTNTNVAFFLKECGRIECEKCIKHAGDGKSMCVDCNKSCKTLRIEKTMKPEVLSFFQPIPVLLQTIIKANSFQNKQRELSYNHMRKRYAAARNEVLKCYKIIDAYKREFAQLKMRNEQFSASASRSFSTSTPLKHTSMSPSCFEASLSTVNFTPKHSYPRLGPPSSERKRSIPVNLVSPAASSIGPSSVLGFPQRHSVQRTQITPLMSQMLLHKSPYSARRQ
ncbi:hypothetical protein QE152_g6207 [Popillia japonica]|uniref:RING-type domain-containing protein n=1 Tax=Popillia japonica TaxID=7064 RepID=A0AAW1MFW8_POPJA